MDKVNQKMRRFNLRGVFVGLKSSVTTPQKSDVGIEESLKSEHFQIGKIICHGFPYQPTALACDPLQNILAIGNRCGAIKIIGKPGVEYDVQHEVVCPVNQLIFLINEGSLISVTADDQIHMWTLRQKKPELVHSLKFQRERISVCHLPFQSKWLYVGTERGNVQIVNLESFTLSGYIINWNKAMDLIRLAHPGPVVHLSDNPIDPNKLLIGFETGSVVLWDFKIKAAETRFSCLESLKSVCWHQDGKQFICSHADGSLTVWNTKLTQRPQSYMMPHAKLGKDGKPELCKAIPKVDYRSVRNGEPFIIFSGGTVGTNSTPSLTVMHGNNMTVLEMEHPVVDFLVLCSTPWNNDFQDPHAIVVLLQNDLVVVDLTTPGYPCFENPYPMDIHESPVTACAYFADCPHDLVPAFYSVGCKRNRTGYSEKEWPIHGGEWTTAICNYPEIIITGHADGSVKFWDASSVTLQVLYKLKTAKVFDPSKCRSDDEDDDQPFAVQHIHLCVESRLLCIAGSSHVVLFRFSKQEATIEFPVLDISIVYETSDGSNTPDVDYPVMFHPKNNLTHQSGSIGSYSNVAPSNGKEPVTSVKARSGARKWPAGYQPDLCCLLTWIDNEPAPPITSLSVNSRFGLLAFGDECGVAVVDIIQKTCLLSMGTPDLYGSLDPYSRAPRSPKLKTTQSAKLSTFDHLSQTTLSDDCRSPTVEQTHLQRKSHILLNKNDSGSSCHKRQSHQQSRKQENPNVKSPQTAQPAKKSAFKTFSYPYGNQLKEQEEARNSASAKELYSLEDSKLKELPEDEEEEKGLKNQERQSILRESSSAMPVAPKRHSGRLSNLEGKDSRKSGITDVGSWTVKEEEDSVQGLDKNDETLTENKKEVEEKVVNEPFANVAGDAVDERKNGSGEEEEEEDIDAYFKDYAKSLQNSNQSINENPGLDDKLARRLAAGDAVDSANGAGRPMARGSEPQLNVLAPSRSVSMLKKLVSRKRADYIFNKSVSEDLCGGGNSDILEAARNASEGLIPTGSKISEVKNSTVSNPDVYKLDENLSNSMQKSVSNSSVGSDHGDGVDCKREAREARGLSRLVSGIFSLVGGSATADKEEVSVPVAASRNRNRKRASKIDIIDLTKDDPDPNKHHQSDKTDSSFCRSHSSSTASLENVNKESIVCLVFAEAYTRKTDTTTCPCLWLGTSLGTVLVISLTLPSDPDLRRREPVIVSPSGTIFRLKGSIMAISFLDCNGILIPAVAEQWRDANNKDSVKDEKRSPYNRQSPALKSRISPTSSVEMTGDRQYSIICSEKQARVISLPSQTCLYKVKVTETSCVARADIISFKDSVCLACYVANGHIVVFSLPSLKPLLDVDYITSPNIRVTKTICFASYGHAIYMSSPHEIQKLTLSAEVCESLKDNMGELHIPCNIPEAPKQSFFKNLFGGPTTTVDREELFGESSGKPSKGMAKYTPGPAGLAQEANSATSEIARAKMAAIERGEKLGDLEERTERMKMEAEVFAQSAHQLKMKYKDKKWYQF